MAYQLRIYAPTGAGITSLTVLDSSGTLLGNVAPAGTDTACFNKKGLTTGVTITPSLEDGVTVSMWVVNVDGSVYYQYTDTCTIGYDSTASNIQIRLEVEGTPTTTYYATLSFNANGGTGAPSKLYESSADGTGYVTFTIPSTIPTRSGYTFTGWAANSSGTGTIWYPGGTYTGYGTTTYPGQSHTLYAVWTQSNSGYVWIYNNGWKKYIPWIYSNGWSKCIPWVYSNGWKRGS